MGFVLGIRKSTVCLNGIGSVLIYFEAYSYGWELLFRGSIIRTPVMLMMKYNTNSVQERIQE